jgi:hypothetical protein
MAAFKDIKKYYRFCAGMRKFLAHRVSLEESRSTITKRMEMRGKLFLNLVEKAIYGNPKSPYLKLLELGGYKLQDIIDLVERTGIEKTLERLFQDGVYVSFDEFKGRTKVTRGGKVFDFRESDFDNPFLSGHFEVKSSGTSGPGTRTMIDFDFLTQEAAYRALALDACGLMDAPCILWFPILPGNAGIKNLFRQAKIGRVPIKWFSQVDQRSIRPSIKDRLGTSLSVYLGRLFGSNMPQPEYVDLTEAHRIAQYTADIVQKHSRCSFFTYVNSAVRVSTAARERNLDLKGVFFFITGEPLSRTKLDEIKSTGAEATPYYAFVEGGNAAYGCANPVAPDDMHLLKDRMAVISHKRSLPYSNDIVDALLITSLLPESPKILLNVEIGDYGLISSRECGCKLEAYGFSDHLLNIKSFVKVTSEGMTFSVRDFTRIVEEILPVTFGGSSSDYQVLEESDKEGLLGVTLAVSPRVGFVDECVLVKTVLQELGKGSDSKRLMAEVWSQAGTLKVKRMEPVPNVRGKIPPFRSLKG